MDIIVFIFFDGVGMRIGLSPFLTLLDLLFALLGLLHTLERFHDRFHFTLLPGLQ